MSDAKIAQAVELLDLMLEHFADDGRWTRGRYDDGNRGHCLVGALLHLSRKHRLPRAPAIALLRHLLRQRRRTAFHHSQGPPSRRRSCRAGAGGRRREDLAAHSNREKTARAVGG
jgi:hypothetical protein